MNEIVNAHVKKNVDYKGSASQSQFFMREYSFEKDKYMKFSTHGFARTECVGRICGGSKVLLEEGLANGDIVMKVNDAGKERYYSERDEGGVMVKETKKKTTEQYDLKERDQLYAAMVEIKTESLNWLSTAIDVDSDDKKKQPSNALATDKSLESLQLSFDNITRLTLATKRIAQQLAQVPGTTQSCEQQSKRALELLKELVEPSVKIESALMTPRANLKNDECLNIMKEADVPYMKLELFYKELVQLARLYLPKEKGRAVAAR